MVQVYYTIEFLYSKTVPCECISYHSHGGPKKRYVIKRVSHQLFCQCIHGYFNANQTPRLQVATLHVTFEIYGTTYIEHMTCANQKVLMERPIQFMRFRSRFPRAVKSAYQYLLENKLFKKQNFVKENKESKRMGFFFSLTWNLQIQLIIQHMCVEPALILWYLWNSASLIYGLHNVAHCWISIMILILALVLQYPFRSGSNCFYWKCQFYQKLFVSNAKINRNYTRRKNTKIGGNSRASCFKPINNCRASIQFNMQKLKVHEYDFKALSTCKCNAIFHVLETSFKNHICICLNFQKNI